MLDLSYEEVVAYMEKWARLPFDVDLNASDSFKTSLAHEAAKLGCLPADFKDWAKADMAGWTVAHEAVATSSLPVSVENIKYLFICSSQIQGSSVFFRMVFDFRSEPEYINKWIEKVKSNWDMLDSRSKHEVLTTIMAYSEEIYNEMSVLDGFDKNSIESGFACDIM
jgi:hypothetical protein